MSATSGGGGSVSEGSDAGGSSQSTMSVSDSPSTSFQTNVGAESVTKITLSEENGSGGYVADMTGSKINLTLDERQQKDGIVNVAFDYEEGANRGSSGGGGGGEFISMNGSEKKDKVSEAVNLELVNMVPYSNGNGTSYGVPVNGIPGIPLKKDSEQVDMSTPYDEYFVPVNEHKKYMRGEKLYVTKDKRRPTSWRRCLSWIVACTVISVVLVIAILAGTGVILSQEPDLVKDASVGRNFAGSNLKPSVTDKSFTPTAEKLMYVPRSIESEFVIDNLNFDPAFRDINSTAYQHFTSSIEDQLKMLLFDKETLEFGASEIGVKVVNISRDPFKVKYRIGWNYKQGVNNPPEPIKMEDVKRRLVESLARNQGYIDKYHIDKEAIKVNHVINACQMENGGCSHICYYNYLTQLFTCTCPTHLVLDNKGKNCVAWSGPSEDDAVPIPSHAAYPGTHYESTSNPAQEFEYSSDSQHGVHQGGHYHRDSDSDHSTDSAYKSHIDQQHREHEPVSEPIPEPTAEPDPSQKDTSSIVVEGILEPTPQPNVKENHHEDPDHDMHSDNVNSQNEDGGQNVHLSSENSGSEVVSEPTPEPTLGGKYDQAHFVYGSEEPGSESTVSKGSDPSIHSSHESNNNEPAAEPTPEPSSESDVHDHVIHSIYDSKSHEPTAETTADPSPEPAAEPKANDKINVAHSMNDFKDHEPAAEPTPEPSAEPTAEPNADDKAHDKHSVNEFKDHEPAEEPTSEPSAEPTLEPVPGSSDHGHAVHSADDSKNHEAAAESTPGPSLGSGFHDYVVHSMYESKNYEPVAEPTPEPTPEPVPEPTNKPDPKGKDHAVHPLYESGYHELVTETTPGPIQQGQDKEHDTHSSKNNEPVPEPTPEPSHEDQNREFNTHFMHESKDLPEATTVSTFLSDNQAAEPSPKSASEPASEPPAGDDHLIHSSKVEASEHLGATEEPNTHLLHPKDEMNAGLNSSLNVSKQQPLSLEEQMQVTDFKTEYPNVAHPERQGEPDKYNESKHQVPYLQDILIKAPNSDSVKKNATSHGESLLQSVEFTENGEPVIEEILVDKPRQTNESETSSSAIPSNSYVDKELGRSNPVLGEGPEDVKNVVTISSDNNSTSGSVLMNRPSGDANETQTMPPQIADGATGGSKTTDESAVQQSAVEKKQINNGDFESIETSTGNGESAIKNDQESTRYFNAGANYSGVDNAPLNSESGIDQEHKFVNLPQDRVPDSTIQPEIQHEYHTIPVAIDFSSSSERNVNIEEKPNHGIKAESERPHTTEKINVGREEESSETIMNSNNDLMLKGAGLDQTKPHEVTTESQIATTMIFSVLSPDAVVGKVGSQLPLEEVKDPGLREAILENRTIHEDNHPESNETTKLPEELSNNIKDELLDNEEFNTLLGKEHKKESGTSDGKEFINKYPSKAQKIEKKKLKDYIKGEKLDSDKKVEVTVRPAVTPEDFILQKHVNGNENNFDLDYSLQNEHTTKHDGEVTVIDPYRYDEIPGVSFKPHGINNHDLKVLQTVAPDSTSEMDQTHDLEAQKHDPKVKLLDSRDGEKQDKDYGKFDKDYKYEKQKVSKKKDLKKKGGSGKDGKNVELDEGRKYLTETSKENTETNQDIFKDTPEIVSNSFDKITVQTEAGARLVPGSADETTAIPEYKEKVETTFQPNLKNALEKRTEIMEDAEEYTGQSQPVTAENDSAVLKKHAFGLQDNDQHRPPVDQNYHQMVDEPSVKTTSNVSPGTVFDEQWRSSPSATDLETEHVTTHSSGPITDAESIGLTSGNSSATPGTVFDGTSEGTTLQSFAPGSQSEITGTVLDGAAYGTSSAIPKIVMNEDATLQHSASNTTTANPTIIIHGQSGSLQDGHIMRFANATFRNNGDVTVIPLLNGTLSHTDDSIFTFTNNTSTFPNGSVVQPTIIVRGQSGTLQDGHEIRFGNTTLATSQANAQQNFKNSTVYRIENGSLPGTVFDGHFNAQDGHYHMFSNSSGTFVYSNVTAQPTFIIKGESGDFGNSRAYIMANDSGSAFSRDFTGPSVIFRNSTVFAVGNTAGKEAESAAGSQETTGQPLDLTSNETIHYTRQMSPNFFSTGTAYKVNNYFGYISKCAAGQFQCVNGTSKRGSACINLSSKCDSINDCSDGSDELGCIENGCPGNFRCSDGSCLKRNLVCNGILDCSDGSDEKQCESWKCEFDEFQCPSGRCIPVVWQCDGKPDCDNHTDEYNCQTSCGNDEYLCPEGWCVPLTYRCNGVKECRMGEDEQLCDCSHEEFKCQTGGCVSMNQICDGLDDCPDRSDEWDCVKLEPGSNLLKVRSASGGFEPVCADDWTSRNSDEVCASLGYYSSVPMENENSSSITTETSFFVLKNVSTDNFNKRVIVNLEKSEGNCSSGKLVAVTCQDFSCGSRSMTDSSSVEARLVGGMSATAGQWPSVALLYNIRNFHSCTANVLTPRWVLASYNCLKMGSKNLNEQDWKFFGGSTVFEVERENAETRKIKSIIPHPQVKFNQFLYSNDMALVELDQSLQFTSNLGAVCLPEQEMQPRQICVTAGWGMNTPEEKSIRQQLQYLPVPTMNLTECNSTEHYSGFITDDKICAGYNSAQKSLCYNEEGAPLMCVNDKGEWELQGVLSYHSNCGRGSHPSIFSSITPVADWIKRTIGNSFERKAVAISKR